MLKRSRDLLQGIFNFARTKLDTHQSSQQTGRKAADRLADSPASLSERPVVHLILDAFETGQAARHVTIGDASRFGDVDALREHIEARISSGAGLVTDVEFGDLGPISPIAQLDASTGILSINLEHPFVAHFADEFSDAKSNLPLQLYAMSEITLEAQLRAMSTISLGEVPAVMADRDQLLRHLARDTGRRNSLTVAQDLLNAASDKKGLEDAVVAAFDQLGFEAVPKGGPNNPDGLADAFLPPADGVPGNYRVSLEAKSKEQIGKKVTKDSVKVSTIARHRKNNGCNHAIVIGPGFEGATDGAVVEEIDNDRAAHKKTGETITLMDLKDLAQLVRFAPLKRINLVQIRGLFQARTPAEAAKWVENALAKGTQAAPYKDILEVVWAEQQVDGKYSVTYDALRVALRKDRELMVEDQDLRNDCMALDRMAPTLFYAHPDRVELNIKPEKVLAAIRDYVEQAPRAIGD